MKKISILALSAVVLFAACNPKYNRNDARTFGLKGDVKEVHLSEVVPSEPGDPMPEDDSLDQDRLEMTFDERGRVTLDPYGNVYEYDGEGHFLGGQVPNTEVVRDTHGRLVSYDNTSFDDFEDIRFDIGSFSITRYTYDGKGRPVTADINGWEWGTIYTYTYDGGKVYPASATFEGGSEGWNEAGKVTYTYTGFDAKGNWTERNVSRMTCSWELPWEENPNPPVDTTFAEMKQIRVIKYWSDKN